jgi:putative transposase
VKKLYPSDLTDSQWNHIKDLFPMPKATGRPRENEFRRVVNGILYIAKTGVPWRYLPKAYGKWGTLYDYFRQWRITGLWKRIHDTLRSQLRVKKGRHKHATAGAIDSQSVKTTAVAGIRGFDAGKKITGIKRHILVDTMGLLIFVLVTAASVQDRDGAKLLLKRLGGNAKKLRKIWVDGGYRGKLLEWVKARFKFVFEVVLRSDKQKGFEVLPRRWVVERTFAWLNNYRRLSKDYERLTETGEAFIQIAMMRLMLLRLKPN